MSRNFQKFCWNIRQVCPNCNLQVYGNDLMKTKNLFSLISDIEGKKSSFCRIVSDELFQTVNSVSVGTIWRNIFSERLPLFRIFSENFSGVFFSFFPTGLSELLFTSPYSSQNLPNFSWNIPELRWNLRQSCQNFNPRVSFNNLMKSILKSSSSLSEIGRNCILKLQGFILQAWKTSFGIFVDGFLAGWSERQATTSLEALEGTHISWINCVRL